MNASSFDGCEMPTGVPASEAEVARALQLVDAARPDLAGRPRTIHPLGWDCVALSIGRTMFRVPRSSGAASRLAAEPSFATLIARHTRLQVPHVALLHEPALIAMHEMVLGETVDAATYRTMDAAQREGLAQTLARWFADLHAIAPQTVRDAGCDRAAARWPSAERILTGLSDRLDPALLACAAHYLSRGLGDPPDRLVFGHFDSHGWNMAYDYTARRLVGLFDFGQAGIGSLHTDLSYPAFVSPDLAARTARAYAARTGRSIDVARVLDRHTTLLLLEIVWDAARDPARVWALTDWLAARTRFEADASHHPVAPA